jgi:hypothetical protein
MAILRHGRRFDVFRRSAIRIGAVLALVLAAAGAFAVVGRADDPRFHTQASIGPGFVDAGSNVLVKASWEYLDTRTLNHVSVRFTVPAGWILVEAAPDVCSQAAAGAIVTCPRDRIRPGDPPLEQDVELQTTSALGDKPVLADLLFAEGPANPGRLDTVPALPTPHADVISTTDTPNKIGKCVSPAGATVATDAGVGDSETSAVVPASDELCTPFSIDENVRVGQEGCIPPPYVCTLDVVNTDSAVFPASDPIKLKIIFRGQQIPLLPLIFTSPTPRQIPVPECTDDAFASPDPCWSDRKLQGNRLTYFVNWTGDDPTWTG